MTYFSRVDILIFFLCVTIIQTLFKQESENDNIKWNASLWMLWNRETSI